MIESQKEKLMRILGINEIEAQDLINTDKAIDQGVKNLPFDLTKEQQKAVKKAKNAGTKTVYNFDTSKKQPKENLIKAKIITEFEQFLLQNVQITAQNVKITNKERQIAFSVGENDYELTIVQKRKPKS